MLCFHFSLWIFVDILIILRSTSKILNLCIWQCPVHAPLISMNMVLWRAVYMCMGVHLCDCLSQAVCLPYPEEAPLLLCFSSCSVPVTKVISSSKLRGLLWLPGEQTCLSSPIWLKSTTEALDNWWLGSVKKQLNKQANKKNTTWNTLNTSWKFNGLNIWEWNTSEMIRFCISKKTPSPDPHILPHQEETCMCLFSLILSPGAFPSRFGGLACIPRQRDVRDKRAITDSQEHSGLLQVSEIRKKEERTHHPTTAAPRTAISSDV